jgi:hypothetical protein
LLAIVGSNFEEAKTLLEQGANPNGTHFYGRSVLLHYLASTRPRTESMCSPDQVVNLLLDYGALGLARIEKRGLFLEEIHELGSISKETLQRMQNMLDRIRAYQRTRNSSPVFIFDDDQVVVVEVGVGENVRIAAACELGKDFEPYFYGEEDVCIFDSFMIERHKLRLPRNDPECVIRLYKDL